LLQPRRIPFGDVRREWDVPLQRVLLLLLLASGLRKDDQP
jgi:hypothetical protein